MKRTLVTSLLLFLLALPAFAGADAKVMDQYARRQKEMKIRIARECK